MEGCDAGVSFRSVPDPSAQVTYTVISNTTDGAWPICRFLDERLGSLAAGVLELLLELGDAARRPLVVTLRLAKLPLRLTKCLPRLCELAFELFDSSRLALARRPALGSRFGRRLRRAQCQARQRIEGGRLDLVRQHAVA